VARLEEMGRPGSALPALAGVLRTSPESDALIILGQLLDSLPIGFYVTDCSDDFQITYANRAWERSLKAEKLPLVGKPLKDVFETAEQSGLLGIMREVERSARPRHLKGFELVGLERQPGGLRPGPTRSDWEIYPLSDAAGTVTHILNVVLNLGSRPSGKHPDVRGSQLEANRLREEASGVLRIFGVAPDIAGPERDAARLTRQERRVAELVAIGLTNADIARRLSVSPATVSSHVANILGKLQFRSRASIAAWVVEQRMSATTARLSADPRL